MTTLETTKKKPRPQAVTMVSSAERQRVQIDFTTEAYKHLGGMKSRAGVKSNADLVKNALRLYDWYLAKRDEEYKILIAKGDSVQQVELLI